jgi:hypothetical protein
MYSDTLRDNLIKLKNKTEELINAMENEKDENLDNLFVQRQQIINSINKLSYSREEFVSIANSIELQQIFKKLEETFETKKTELKEKVNGIKTVKTANASYISNSNAVKNLFNTKV